MWFSALEYQNLRQLFIRMYGLTKKMKQNYLLVSKQIDFELLITYLKISVKIFKPNKSALYMLKPFVMHTLGFAKTRNA